MKSHSFQETNEKIHSISLVDDDLVSNLITSNTIQKSGLVENVSAFDNARDALNAITKASVSSPDDIPEIIFLDIAMPAMDGLEFLDELDKIKLPARSKCRVFMLSSSINPVEIQDAIRHRSVCDFISKPLTLSKLKSIFSQWGYA